MYPTVRVSAPSFRQFSFSFLSDQDRQALNYALTLEQVQQSFYRQGLQRFDDNAFKQAGFPPFARARYQQILEHEDSHVKLLNDTLGSQAVKPCNYSLYVWSLLSSAAILNCRAARSTMSSHL